MKIFIIVILFHLPVFSQMPIPTESFQLQLLINKSEEQLQLLKESLKNSKQDADHLEKAYLILAKLSAGADKTVENYKGTKVYTDALIKLQSVENSKKTYSDSESVRTEAANIIRTTSGNKESLGNKFADFVEFQKKSVEANLSDIVDQEKLHQALDKSEPGYVPKIQALIQLGSWQTNTRLSAQNTGLLSAIQSVREEMRILRIQESGSDTLGTLLIGSEVQNQKQKAKENR